MTMDFSEERLSYEKGTLNEADLPLHPKPLFEQWIKQAVDENLVEPYAMSLATCGSDNMPSVRTVLMREVSEISEDNNDGFGVIFYSNYDSAKGQDLIDNPNAEALFFWHSLERQVRIRGQVRKLSEEKSTAYFHKRPHDSQVAAWVSQPQSGKIASREHMEAKFASVQKQYASETSGNVAITSHAVPKPEFWGGYEIVVTQVEFWQGRANRMHDRILYVYQTGAKSEGVQNVWQMSRLLP